MKKLSSIVCLLLLLTGITNAYCQSGNRLTVDSVTLTTNPSDVSTLISLGEVDVRSDYSGSLSSKKDKAQAELLLKSRAVTLGGNVVLVTVNEIIHGGTIRSGWHYAHMKGSVFNGKILSNQGSQQSSVINTNDLSGSWVGYQTNGQLIMHYELNLKKVGDNYYSGYDYCRWEKNANGMPMQYNGSAVPSAKKVFLASFKDGYLNVSEISNIEKGSWDLLNEKFKLSDNHGVTVFVNGDGNNGQRTFSLKRTGDYPVDYLKYIISSPALKVDTVNYRNRDLAAAIGYNEKGELEFTVRNNTAIDFKGLKTMLAVETDNAGIDFKGSDAISFDVPGSNQTIVDVPIASNFMLPAGMVKIRLTVYSNGNPLVDKDFSLDAHGFFKTANVTVPSYASTRMRAVSGFYGLNSTLYKSVPLALDPVVASGDKIAGMWKAVFLSMGYGEYKIDESLGYSIGKNSLKTIENSARNGDAEAMYLMFYACQMGLEGEAGKSFAPVLLEKAANAGFKPAVFDYSGQMIINKDYTGAFTNFSKSYDLGVAKAATIIGQMYEKGLSVTPDIDQAVQWYKKGMAFGDPDATLCYAELVSKGVDNTPPNISKALELATAAAAKNCTPAMIFIGKVYADGKKGIPQSFPMAIKWFKSAADLGDRQAMYELGQAYITSKHGMTKDENSAIFWLKRAAELGSPGAMVMLADCYKEGTFGEKDVIAERFWYNQSVLSGFAQADGTGVNATRQSFMDFWKYADFSPSYIYVNEYGEKVGDGDDALENGFMTGIFGAMSSYYLNQQQLIDGLEFIHKKNGFKIYGGTVSSKLISNLFLKKGETIHIHSYGIISTGMMSGLANADGLGNAWAEYRIVQDIPCSAVMAGVTDGPWRFIGQDNTYTAPKDGALVLGLNGIDYSNYKGYFDLVIEVPEN